jgi:hypothetical protein
VFISLFIFLVENIHICFILWSLPWLRVLYNELRDMETGTFVLVWYWFRPIIGTFQKYKKVLRGRFRQQILTMSQPTSWTSPPSLWRSGPMAFEKSRKELPSCYGHVSVSITRRYRQSLMKYTRCNVISSRRSRPVIRNGYDNAQTAT